KPELRQRSVRALRVLAHEAGKRIGSALEVTITELPEGGVEGLFLARLRQSFLPVDCHLLRLQACEELVKILVVIFHLLLQGLHFMLQDFVIATQARNFSTKLLYLVLHIQQRARILVDALRGSGLKAVELVA